MASHDERVLGLIPYDGALTISDLVRDSGLSRPTVTGVLGRLHAAGAVEETVVAPAGLGRPAKRWRRPPRHGTFGVIALSRDAVRVRVVVGDDRHAAERERRLDVSLDAQGALVHGHRFLRECLTELGAPADGLSRVVLGLPCPVGGPEGDHPRVRGILPDWIGIRPAESLRALLPGTAIVMENDANLGALGELEQGAGRGGTDLVYIKLAPGLGAALILGRRRLHRGAAGLAGEIGHVQINPMGHPCACGARGCLATEIPLDPWHEPPASAEPFPAGDPAADRVLHRLGALLGEQLGALANLLDPGRVIVSTDTTPPPPVLLDGIRDGIRRTALPVVSDLPVVASPLGIRAELIGGIALARSGDATPSRTGDQRTST
ncbi:ROK family transcriptional regulator [Actinomadura harenae]|uniref:ROK family transcriptional regulator n=1 Tax=Actinomadura harenae TaxID=2483351 RepID=A0A3M2LPD9_9ACTN|nr:ROK family transcriptional regulator [Actinomadura harenae]RMI36698.1 ROK family transcriptional regulator [Actinomadura harenae]